MRLPEKLSKWSFVPGLVILILFGIFCLIGVVKPEVGMEGEVTVNQTAETAWVRFTDTTRYGEWIPGFMAWSRPKGRKLKPGATWSYLTYHEGATAEMAVSLDSVSTQKQYAWTVQNDALVAHINLHLQAEGGRTKLVGAQRVEGKGIMYRSALVLFRGVLDRQFQEQLDRIKNMMESQ